MVITSILIVIFLIAILSQMAFLGRYISITQNIFNNRTLASFALGAIVYFGLTFLVLFPFVWINTPLIWFAITVFIKDFLTIVFLIIKRYKIKVLFFDFWQVACLIIMGAAIPVFYHYGLSQWIPLHDLPSPTKHFGNSNMFRVYTLWIEALSTLSQTSAELIRNFLVGPIVGVIIFMAVGSLYFEFVKHKNLKDMLVLMALTIGLIILFNLKISLEDFVFCPFMLLLVQYGYNLIAFSRRRYGTFFGITALVIWMINPFGEWAIFFIALAVALTYIMLRKRRPAIFIVQLFSPLIMILALNFASYSLLLSFFLTILTIALYSSIFFFNRIAWIEKTNALFTALSYWWLIISCSVIVVTGLILWPTTKIDWVATLVKNNEPLTHFSKLTVFAVLQNILYYTIFGALVVYCSFLCFTQKRLTKVRLIVVILTVCLLLGYNPWTQFIFTVAGGEQAYHFLKLVIFPPLTIISTTVIFNKQKLSFL